MTASVIEGAGMRTRLIPFLTGLVLLLLAACTTTPRQERPKILCPACGTELDSIYHQHF